MGGQAVAKGLRVSSRAEHRALGVLHQDPLLLLALTKEGGGGSGGAGGGLGGFGAGHSFHLFASRAYSDAMAASLNASV